MRIEAINTEYGAFVPIIIKSDELTVLEKPIFFLIDTGADFTTISACDVDHEFDYSCLEKGLEVGGTQVCYLIHNVSLIFLSNTDDWIIGKDFSTLDFLPFIYDRKTSEQIYIPSLLGRDIIGSKYKLSYENNSVYLE